MNPYTDATDKTKLTIVDSYGITIPSGNYNVTNMGGMVELWFMACNGTHVF